MAQQDSSCKHPISTEIKMQNDLDLVLKVSTFGPHLGFDDRSVLCLIFVCFGLRKYDFHCDITFQASSAGQKSKCLHVCACTNFCLWVQSRIQTRPCLMHEEQSLNKRSWISTVSRRLSLSLPAPLQEVKAMIWSFRSAEVIHLFFFWLVDDWSYCKKKNKKKGRTCSRINSTCPLQNSLNKCNIFKRFMWWKAT